MAMHRVPHGDEQASARQLDSSALDGAATRLLDVEEEEPHGLLPLATAVAALARPVGPAAPVRHAESGGPQGNVGHEQRACARPRKTERH